MFQPDSGGCHQHSDHPGGSQQVRQQLEAQAEVLRDSGGQEARDQEEEEVRKEVRKEGCWRRRSRKEGRPLEEEEAQVLCEMNLFVDYCSLESPKLS